jgi:hypothetical protein
MRATMPPGIEPYRDPSGRVVAAREEVGTRRSSPDLSRQVPAQPAVRETKAFERVARPTGDTRKIDPRVEVEDDDQAKSGRKGVA